MFFDNQTSHLYTLASTDKKLRGGIYSSRQAAREAMYNYINKKGLKVVDKYDDKHYKTYICNDGTYFYINRV